LIATLTGFRFEVFDETSIQQDSDALLARRRLETDTEPSAVDSRLRYFGTFISLINNF